MTFVFYRFFPLFFKGGGPRPNQHTSTSRLDQLHVRVERFFFADIQKTGVFGERTLGVEALYPVEGEEGP